LYYYYHINEKIDENTKYQIDYNKLKNILHNNIINEKDSLKDDYNIPKELLLNYEQITKLIVNEIKIINRNKTHKHYIIQT
jgi:regulator of replication initiation timing